MSQDIDLAAVVKASKLAQMLDVHVGTVQRWILSGRLKGFKLHRVWYIRKEDAEQLFQRPNPRAKPARLNVEGPRTSAWAHDVLRRFGLEK